MTKIWLYRLAVLWAALFVISALCSCILAAFQGGVKWAALDGQGRFLLVVAIVLNVCTTVGAFVSKEAKALQQAGGPSVGGDAEVFTETPKQETKTDKP